MHLSLKPAHADARKPRRLLRGAPRTRSVIAVTALLIVCGAPFATARTGDNLREGVRNGTTTSETEIIANIATTTAAKGGYAMRMSNLSLTGGGFINGCRASAAATSKPCYRANNLSTGRAFEFNTNLGDVVGTITAGPGGDTKKPFTTNATGVATGLNADRVDNLHASEIIAAARQKTGLAAATADDAANADKLDGLDASALVAKSELLWALVDADAGGGTIVRGRGVTAGDAVPSPATGRFVVTFNRDISTCGIQATLGDATATAGSDGEISADQPSGSSVEINTSDSAGAPENPLATDGFYLQVTC